MGFGSRALLAGGLGFTVAFVVACGSSSGLLSSGQSSKLAGDLDSISSAVASQNCARAHRATSALNKDVAKLPSSVNSTLLNNLGQGAGTVSQLAARDCSSSSSSTSTTTTTTYTTTTYTTTATPTTPTTTTPPPTSSSSSSTSTTATNPAAPGTSSTGSGGVGLGQGNGNGNGNGAGNGASGGSGQ